ncbi:MAG: FHA domain-containing protein, partial [Deltaproteobacteria bacterium]|nr:FHA domain-containing protein [Deltaproteobacteria bacterium]
MEPVPVLVAVGGALAGNSYVITEVGLRMGRDVENEIVIEEAGTSRQHARVILHNGAVWVQDAGSRNGVFVNGERVPDHRQLKPGDRVQVSQSVFEVQLSLPAAASAPPAPSPLPPSRPVPRAEPRALEERKPAWKIWPFAVALLLTLGCIGCIGMIGWLHPTDDEAASAPGPGPSYSLAAVIPADGSTPSAPS